MASTSQPEKVESILPRLEGVDRRGLSRDHSRVTIGEEIDFFIAQANEARREMVDAAAEYRQLAHEESRLEAIRPELLQAIKALLMTENVGLSATNADKLAHSDPAYLKHLELQRDTVRDKDNAATKRESSRIQSMTAVAALYALGGWQ